MYMYMYMYFAYKTYCQVNDRNILHNKNVIQFIYLAHDVYTAHNNTCTYIVHDTSISTYPDTATRRDMQPTCTCTMSYIKSLTGALAVLLRKPLPPDLFDCTR